MNVKRFLIENLPPSAKHALSIPYDIYQTRKADSVFGRKNLVERGPADDAPQHVVWVVVDALRSDHVDGELTPYMSSLDGVDAVTPGAWTFPAVSSIITGLYPHEHGAMKQSDEPEDSEGLTLPPRMDEERETLTEALAGAGYDTYGGFGHDTPFVALSGRFESHALYHKVNSDAGDVLDDYLEWVKGRGRTFAFLHLADPHIPLDPPQKYWEKHDVDGSIEGIQNWRFHEDVDCGEECQEYRENRRRLYRASVDYVDDELRRFHDSLVDVVEDPNLVVTSDHGEAMWEHVEFDVEHFDGTGCVDHGGAPYEELARVPLLTNSDWRLEGAHVSLVDLPATLLDEVGLEEPETSGFSLVEGVPEDRQTLVEGSLSGHEKKAVYDGNQKLIASRGDGLEMVLGVPSDEPVEVDEDRLEELRDLIPPWPDEEAEGTDVGGVVEDRLETLGYR